MHGQVESRHSLFELPHYVNGRTLSSTDLTYTSPSTRRVFNGTRRAVTKLSAKSKTYPNSPSRRSTEATPPGSHRSSNRRHAI
ncbi:hypothetical protein TNCV_3644771 [Trichonephila clavipes]|nr:hypothetical protein TNCV_3644771 [Trichonephila clavipes]